jgi:hypothetical protein
MMTIDQVATATLDQLTDELAAAGWDSEEQQLRIARESVAKLIYSTQGPFFLIDSELGENLGQATEAEFLESVLAGPEGHIMFNGLRCYVAA